jgi:hypothetical protein
MRTRSSQALSEYLHPTGTSRGRRASIAPGTPSGGSTKASAYRAAVRREPAGHRSRLSLRTLHGRLDEHLSRFVEHMTQGLLAASTAVGLDVVVELMELEVAELAGPKGRHNPARAAKRHGNDQGTVTLGGRRLPIRRPRVRSTGDQERELPLESYATFASTDLLAEQVVARMLAGLSTRRYPAGLEPVGSGSSRPRRGRRSRRSRAGLWPRPLSGWPSCWRAAWTIGAGWWCSWTGSGWVSTCWSARWA